MKKGIKALLCTVAVGALAVFGAGCSLTETLKQLTCKHDYGATATEVTKNATCTDEGAELWTCTLCGKEKTETIAKTEHAFDEGIVTKAATCTATGEILYTCMTCETEKTELIEKTEHTRVDVEAKAPTCTEDGYTEYAYCADCNIFLSPKTVLNATGHTPTRVNGYAATCTEKGLTNGEVCATCETVLTAQTEIAAKGHNIVTVKGYAATCTGTGLTDGQACSTCGTVYVEQTEIAALGHSDADEDGFCDNCEGELTATFYMTETAVEEGELVAGNWYRIYRPDSGGMLFQLTVDGTSTIQFIAYEADKGYDENYVFDSGPLYTLDGLEVVYGNGYIDIHLVAGTYTVSGSGLANGTTVTIDNTTVVSSFSNGVYRLEASTSEANADV